MLIGILREILPDEKRVAATPEAVKKYRAAGFEVSVETGAGSAAGFPDAAFEAAGAAIASDARALCARADILLKVRTPCENKAAGAHEIKLMREGAVFISLLQPLVHPELIPLLVKSRITALAMDLVPRIARAQKLDALSSQSNIAGYKAVLLAASELSKIMPLMMTAAGTISPARVFVLGAGVAGLQAIATAKRLGALVEAYDVRPVVKEQVESLGARFVSLEIDDQAAEDKGGYAKVLPEEIQKKGQELVAAHAREADMIITTALIPGKPAPRLITRSMIETMKPGSVIVDLAVEGGGNCEGIAPGETVEIGGVKLMAPLNVPSLMAAEASQLYARNVSNLLLDFSKDGQLTLDPEDEIIQGALVTEGGAVKHPLLLKQPAGGGKG